MNKLSSLFVGVAAVAMAFATPTLAAKPVGVPLPEDGVRLDLCAFPVQFHYLQWGRKATTHDMGTARS